MFARKIIRRFAIIGQRDLDAAIRNEARVIEKLRANGGQKNITQVIRHGWLDEERYFIDMEACIINLEDFISTDVKSVLGPSKYFGRQDANGNWRCLSFQGIMEDITNGLNFIHSQKELHRDLKPTNGMFAFSPSNVKYFYRLDGRHGQSPILNLH